MADRDDRLQSGFAATTPPAPVTADPKDRGQAAPPPFQGPPAPPPFSPEETAARDKFMGGGPAEITGRPTIDMTGPAPEFVTSGWNDEQYIALEGALLAADKGISPEWLAGTMQMIMKNSDPSIMDDTMAEFRRQVGLSTGEAFEEKALNAYLGITTDSDALAYAARDRWLETNGALDSVALKFAKNQDEKQTFEGNYLESKNVRGRIETEVTNSLYESFGVSKEAISKGYASEISGLRGKKLEWVNDGDTLYLRWFDEDDKAPVDVKIHLDEGTEINTPMDVVAEYLLADDGLKHLVDPSSGDVPGRQTFFGALIEGFDDSINGVEQFIVSSVNQASTEIAIGMTAIGRENPVPEQRETDLAALAEQENMKAVIRTDKTDAAMVDISIQYAALNPDATMSEIVQSGFLGFGELVSDEDLDTAVADTFADLDKANKAKADEQSFIGQIFEEDVAPTVLEALDIWNNALYLTGVTLMDASMLTARALADPGGAADQFQEVMDVGLPLATKAYAEDNWGESFSDYFGLDPESNWAGWVNTAGLIGVDPITWATLGANASWKGLMNGLTTTAGVERLVRSRPMLSAFRNIVVKNKIGTVTLLAEGGMRGPAVVRLAEISATTYTTKAARVEAIQEVMGIVRNEFAAAGTGGMYIPAAPRAALRRKSTLGLADLAAITPKDSKARGFMQDILIRAQQSRKINLTDRDWLLDEIRRIEVYRLNDAAGYADDVAAAVEKYKAYRNGDTTIAALQGKTQVLKGEIEDLSHMSMVDDAGKLVADEMGQVPRLRKYVTEWDTSVKELDARLAKMGADDPLRPGMEQARNSAIASRDEARALIDANGMGTRYDARIKALAKKQREIASIKSQVDDLGTAGRDRSLLEHHSLKYYDDWAEEWGIPKLLDADGSPVMNPLFNDIFERDWDSVLGKGQSASTAGTRDVSGLSGFGRTKTERAANEAKLKALGMHAEQGVAELPISPTELLAWKTMQRNATTRAVWEGFQRHPGIKQLGDGMQSLFAASVLLNPVTAIRSHMDEVVRFYQNNGMSADLLKMNVPGSVGGRAVPGAAIGTEAAAFPRSQMGSFVGDPGMAWKLVKPSQRGMWQHAERWVNGSLVKEKLFQGFARSVTNGADDAARRSLFREFWNSEGVRFAKRSTMDGTPIDDTLAYNILNDSFNGWVAGADEAIRSQVSDDILRAAANNTDVGWGPAVWRQLPDVPAQISTNTGAAQRIRHPLDSGFQGLYGSPQNRRGSVFYDHAYEFADEVYSQSYAGKIIDESWLLDPANGVNGIPYARDLNHAQELIAMGNRSQVIRDLVSDTGMILGRDLKNAAMSYAGLSADDMMYSFGATSIFGKKAARVYPFGRAQVDYLQWWWKKLTEPTGFGVRGGKGTGQVPIVGNEAARAASAVTMPRGANIRLIDRMAHLASLGEPGERPGALTPAGIVNYFSFLPHTLDEGTLFDLGPGLSPAAAWTLNLPIVPDGVRNVVQEAHPSHRTFTDPYDNYADAILNVADMIMPTGGMSVRSMASASERAIAEATMRIFYGYDPGVPLTDDEQKKLNPAVNGMIRDRSGGPWFADYVKLSFVEWMQRDGNAYKQLGDMGDDELMDEWNFLINDASFASIREQNADFIGKMAGALTYGGSDFQYVDTLLPVDEAVGSWVASGSISDAKRDSIMIGWSLVNSGEGTIAERLTFADEVLGTVFNTLTPEERTEFFARNMGVAVNLVSAFKVVESLVPSDVRPFISDGKIKTADFEKGRELRERGKKEGWLQDRDQIEVLRDVLRSFHRSVREFYDIIYTRAAEGNDIGKRTITIGDERASVDDVDVELTPDWWNEHKDWMEDTGTLALPQEVKTLLNSGLPATMSMGDFRQIILDAKGGYPYTLEVDSTLVTELNRIGINERPMSSIGLSLNKVEGFNLEDFDKTVDLDYYGADLAKDFQAALNAGQLHGGWSGFDEWDVTEIAIEKVVDGEIVTTVHNPNNLRKRFRTAIALSSMNSSDDKRFTEKNYTNSTYGRQLGELDYERPQPPSLAEIERLFPETGERYFETSDTDSLHVVDGDTIRRMEEDGPVFVRLMGINTPEKYEAGYNLATEKLRRIIDNADTVQLVVWEPDRYGRKVTGFTVEENAIVTRDRLLVWLYIDGVPLFDPREFSRDNIRGVRTGGTIPDYENLLEVQKERMK